MSSSPAYSAQAAFVEDDAPLVSLAEEFPEIAGLIGEILAAGEDVLQPRHLGALSLLQSDKGGGEGFAREVEVEDEAARALLAKLQTTVEDIVEFDGYTFALDSKGLVASDVPALITPMRRWLGPISLPWPTTRWATRALLPLQRLVRPAACRASRRWTSKTSISAWRLFAWRPSPPPSPAGPSPSCGHSISNERGRYGVAALAEALPVLDCAGLPTTISATKVRR